LLNINAVAASTPKK